MLSQQKNHFCPSCRSVMFCFHENNPINKRLRIRNRRKFIELFGCGCCGLILPSCTTVPITERKQLSIYPEATINRQAAAAYETFRSKTKLINDHIYYAW